MENPWWNSNWFMLLLGWIGGIPSGLLANWLYQQWQQRKLRGKDYINLSFSNDEMSFEGKYSEKISIDQILSQLADLINDTKSKKKVIKRKG